MAAKDKDCQLGPPTTYEYSPTYEYDPVGGVVRLASCPDHSLMERVALLEKDVEAKGAEMAKHDNQVRGSHRGEVGAWRGGRWGWG